MQQSEAHQELREIFAARVHDSFGGARYCLGRARTARKDGDHDDLRKWMWCVGVLRTAAARWRRRAAKLTPMLVCLVWCSLGGGCALQPVQVTDSLIVPPALIRPVCGKWHFDKAPEDAHWDGHAVFVWDSDGTRIIAIDCSLLSVSADFVPLFARFDIDDAAARNLREFLSANGIAVNWAP